MTECERIKAEGWLEEDFFNPEIRCEYYVSENMKKVWAILLDLYKKFAEVCEKNDLTYFAVSGTILGAVRHKGFIPWDDDIDVALPRKDYNKLKKLFKEFEYPYFLQSSETDPEYGFSYLRLCNSNTTIVTKPLEYADYNHGIYIDIFPLDYASDDEMELRRNSIYNLIMKNSAHMRLKNPNKSQKDIERINNYYDPNMSPLDVFNKIEEIASMKENDKNAQYLASLVCTMCHINKSKKPKEAYDGYVETPFESLKVRLPIGHIELLKVEYGDYMQFPPVEKRGIWHECEMYPDIPYKDYYKDNIINK